MFRLQGVEGASQQVLQVALELGQLALRLAQPLMNRMMTGWSGPCLCWAWRLRWLIGGRFRPGTFNRACDRYRGWARWAGCRRRGPVFFRRGEKGVFAVVAEQAFPQVLGPNPEGTETVGTEDLSMGWHTGW
jgi:hypothetical protein